MPHDLSDADFWNDAVELVVPLWVAMSLHGYACLGLRHPGTHDNALRPAVVRAVRRLGDLLVARGAITRAELSILEQVEAEHGGLQPEEPGWVGGAVPAAGPVRDGTSARSQSVRATTAPAQRAPVWCFRPERRGAHVQVRVFVGVDAEHLQLAGMLTLDDAAWEAWEEIWTPYALPPRDRGDAQA